MQYEIIKKAIACFNIPKKVVFLVGGIVLALISFGTWYWHNTGQDPEGYKLFVSAYQDYHMRVEQYEVFVYVPGQRKNEERQELEEKLSRILTDENVNDLERRDLAEEGLILVTALKEQIDRADRESDSIERAVGILEYNTDFVAERSSREQAHTVSTLAEERFSVARDILSLSYVINSRTRNILTRIIAESGALSESHIRSLNSQILDAERQFNELFQLYKELTDLGKKMDDAYILFSNMVPSG